MKHFVVLLSFFLLVSSHAVLKSPRPWNTAASKSNPCGGGSAPTAAAATWVAGSRVTLSWQVIAGDGAGDVLVSVNPAGTASFSGTATKVGTLNSVSTAPFTFTVPSVTCTGANGLCSVQVKSSSNWFSCTSVKIVPAGAATTATTAATTRATTATTATTATRATTATTATTRTTATAATTTDKPDSTAAPPAPSDDDDDGSEIQDVCQIVTGLTFCTVVNGNNVTLETGQTPQQLDATAEASYKETLNNPLVFSTPNATGCAEAFKQLFCSNSFPLCGATTACQPNCQDAITKCGLEDSHKGLFDCKQGSPTDCLTPKDLQNGEQNESSAVKIFGIASVLLALLL